ncbi:UDP-glucose 4-epimerase GalE [Rhodoblastus sp.]|uniref:UDP-glucose 4-epimerase GalE n=1 Tax=Rhodoblastus sp. TaxID=1962975 RepID=UPI003F96229F
MSVLVTGGAGYIGSHMAHELLDAGEDVVIIDNLSTGFRWAVPPGAQLVVGDFGDSNLVPRIFADNRIDSIIHFAAKTVVPESVADPLGYYLNNTAKARALLECAVKAGVKNFIFSSTAAVYGNPERNPVAEDDSLNPLSPYGRSKLMVEWMLSDAAQAHDMRYVILRYFNVAGADPQGRAGQSTARATHLIKVATQAALGLRPGMEVFGVDYPTPDGSGLRDYIHVSDLARAHSAALKHLRSGGDSCTCNCGYQTGYSVLEVIDLVKKISGVDFPVKISGRRPGDAAAVIAANQRIKSRLGWTPEYDDLELILRHAYEWERRLFEQPKKPKLFSYDRLVASS